MMPVMIEKDGKQLDIKNKNELPDGSFKGQFGPAVSTSLSMLAIALNYRFLPIYER